MPAILRVLFTLAGTAWLLTSPAHSAHAAHRLTVTTESPRKPGKYSTDRYSPSEAPAAADSIARSGAGVAWGPVAPPVGIPPIA